MGSTSSARKESLRWTRCFSPRELTGMVAGSSTTTMPVMSCCSSRRAVVMTGTMSRDSFSSPRSSATTTSNLLDVNTALHRDTGKREGRGREEGEGRWKTVMLELFLKKDTLEIIQIEV